MTLYSVHTECFIAVLLYFYCSCASEYIKLEKIYNDIQWAEVAT